MVDIWLIIGYPTEAEKEEWVVERKSENSARINWIGLIFLFYWVCVNEKQINHNKIHGEYNPHQNSNSNFQQGVDPSNPK